MDEVRKYIGARLLEGDMRRRQWWNEFQAENGDNGMVEEDAFTIYKMLHVSTGGSLRFAIEVY